MDWKRLEHECWQCSKCGLGKTRTNVVIGRGSKKADIMLVGEGPGQQEDEQGLPFVGRAGQLLDLLLQALMFNEDEYYIANIVKCRPPGNRVPDEQEVQQCIPFLREQVRLVHPKILVCMGSTAAKYIIDKNIKITKIRGNWQESKGFFIMPTFHPAALLRDESKKALMFSDFKMVRERLNSIKSGLK